MASDFPKTPWNGPLSTLRSVGFSRVPLADVRALKTAFGCTVNDVVLGLCAGTLRAYLLDHGDLPDEPLVATCPVSVRTDAHSSQGNRVSAMFTTLDTNLDEPTERIRAIQACTQGAKEEHKAVGADMLQNWAEYAAPNMFNLASRLYSSSGLAASHRPIHNVIISNVPGPDFPLYYAGAEMIAAYPMGPVMEGVGLNITVLSNRGSVDVGFMVDRELVPDVWNMADRVPDALAELQEAAGVSPVTESAADIDEATPATTEAAAEKRAAGRSPSAAKKRAIAARRTDLPAEGSAQATKRTPAKKRAASTRKAPAKKAPVKASKPKRRSPST